MQKSVIQTGALLAPSNMLQVQPFVPTIVPERVLLAPSNMPQGQPFVPTNAPERVVGHDQHLCLARPSGSKTVDAAPDLGQPLLYLYLHSFITHCCCLYLPCKSVAKKVDTEILYSPLYAR
jgi:hypothetical protein